MRLNRIWESLPPFVGTPPVAPPLGYRGCVLRDYRGPEWVSYGGVVTLHNQNREDPRRDEKRTWETLLLASAPRGLLPRSAFGAT